MNANDNADLSDADLSDADVDTEVSSGSREDTLTQSASTTNSLDRDRLHIYCKAIETAVRMDQFEECALLFNELILLLKQYVNDDSSVQRPHAKRRSLRALDHAYDLLMRCQHFNKGADVSACHQLRDDIRNGLTLLLSDILESAQFDESLRAHA